MPNNYIISIVVPVYNVEKYLDQCMESLINQKYHELEILLIDDGSTDNSPFICDEWAKKDNRIKVFHKNNGGLASARNFGLDEASGSFISFVDSDDFINLDMYTNMMEVFQQNDNVDIVCCSGQRFFENNFYEKCFEYYDTGTVLESEVIVKRILKDEIGSQVVKGLYKKWCWDEVRFPLDRLYEDIPVTFLAFARANKIAFIKEPYYFYRQNLESISNTPKPIKPYHIFLGFEQHYLYASSHYNDISRLCLEKAAHYAISTCFHYYTEKNPVLNEPNQVVESFLKAHKKELKKISKDVPKSRRFALKVFYFSKPLFIFMCRLFHLFGLQKKMGFGEK